MTIHVTIIAFVVCSTLAFAQNAKVDCDDQCVKTKFPYRFCDRQGNSLFLCTDNPNNEPGLHPFKQRLPLQACGVKLDMYGEEHPEKMVFYPPSDPRNPTGGAILFDARSVRGSLDAAVAAWNRLCPPQGPDDEHQDCCLRVRWSQDIIDFGSNHMQFAFTRIRSISYVGPARGHKCLFNCEESEMILNRQPEFTQPDAQGFPIHYFVTERDNFPYLPTRERPEVIWVDMQSLLEHELGHWLGFHHVDQKDGYGITCGSDGSIMLGGETGILNNRIATITPADECMFRKLYCCQETERIVWLDDPHVPPEDYPDHTKEVVPGAGPDSHSTGFIIVPNPVATGIITLSLYGSINADGATLRIIDAAGNTVWLQPREGIKEKMLIDVDGLPAGIYMMQLVQGSRVFGRRFIINE